MSNKIKHFEEKYEITFRYYYPYGDIKQTLKECLRNKFNLDISITIDKVEHTLNGKNIMSGE